MPTLEMESAASKPTFNVTLTRVIRASRTRVYQAWTTPELITQWFGPKGFQCSSAAFDVRVGGAYRVAMLRGGEPADSAGSVAVGHYTKVVPDELLQFTWEPSWHPEEHSVVTVSLRDVDGGTELTLTHEQLSSEQSRDGHGAGWAGAFDKLEALLAAA